MICIIAHVLCTGAAAATGTMFLLGLAQNVKD